MVAGKMNTNSASSIGNQHASNVNTTFNSNPNVSAAAIISTDAFSYKTTRRTAPKSAPEQHHSRRHLLPAPSFLTPRLWATNANVNAASASGAASLLESGAAARGEHVQPSPNEATVAQRISALRQLNGATHTQQQQQQQQQRPSSASSSGHRYAKSTGARNSTFSQPVIVRTYSGHGGSGSSSSNYGNKSGSVGGGSAAGGSTWSVTRRWRRGILDGAAFIGAGGGKPWGVMAAPPPPHQKAELPPVEAFSFRGIMDSIQHGVADDLERIAEICARSRYSLSNQYEVHMPPHYGQGAGVLPGGGRGHRQHHQATQQQQQQQTAAGGGGGSGSGGGGPTLQAVVSSDDEHAQHHPTAAPATAGGGGRPPRGPRRSKSAAYGTLETIMSSSRSSEEDTSRKKPAAEIAEEVVVRGRAITTKSVSSSQSGSSSSKKSGSKKIAAVVVGAEGGGGSSSTSAAQGNKSARREHARSKSATFASAIIDSAQNSARSDAQKSQQQQQQQQQSTSSSLFATTRSTAPPPPTELRSELAEPQTSGAAEQQLLLASVPEQTEVSVHTATSGSEGIMASTSISSPAVAAPPPPSSVFFPAVAPAPLPQPLPATLISKVESRASTLVPAEAVAESRPAPSLLESLFSSAWIPWGRASTAATGTAAPTSSLSSAPLSGGDGAVERVRSSSHAEGSLRELLRTTVSTGGGGGGGETKGKTTDRTG